MDEDTGGLDFGPGFGGEAETVDVIEAETVDVIDAVDVVDMAVLDAIEAELADVAHALVRLDDGTYGTCEECGRPFSDEELEDTPALRQCPEHSSSDEPVTDQLI